MVLAAFLSFLGYRDPVYVVRFAREWRRIARLLRKEERYLAWAFLNRDEGYVEFRSFPIFGAPLARVRMYGEMGYPFKAVITSPAELTPAVQAVFERELPIPIKFEIGSP